MMISSEHLRFKIVTNFINQIYLQKGFTTDEIPYYRLFFKVFFMIQNIIYRLFRNIP